MDLASPSAIGSTTPNTGAFTTLNTSNIFGSGSPDGGVAIRNTSTATNFVEFITGVGFFKNSNNIIASINRSSTKSFVTTSDGFFGWGSSTTNADAATPNASLFSDAANILAQRKGTAAQTFRIYNTFTDASNYERGFFRWNTNVLEIGAEAAGTGTQRQLRFPLGTATTSTPLSITQTWNGAGVTFTGLQLNATDTASATGSLLFDFQVGGSSKCRVSKNGDLTITGGFNCTQNSTLDGIITRQAAMYGGSDANGTLILQNSNFNNFNMLKIGGTSTSFPALKRLSAILQVRLADDSGYTVLDAQLRAQGTAPATAGATGTAGDIRYDADYIYICTAANTWKRVAIATW